MNDKKSKLLGMPFGTAQNRLRKELMFSLVKELNKNICFRCGETILCSDELSLDHKESWIATKHKTRFFDLNNVTFSHRYCNSIHTSSRKAKYRGVTYRADYGTKPYVARICINGKEKHLGNFTTAIEAAKAYDNEAKRIHGNKAITNNCI